MNYHFEILYAMKLPKSLTSVTPFSKTLAAILFITFPFLGFYLGTQYEKGINPQDSDKSSIFQNLLCKKWGTVCSPNYTDPNGGCAPKKICGDPSPAPTIYSPSAIPTSIPTLLPPQNPPPEEGVACTQDAKMCSDGSWVGREGPRCEFRKCPGE